IGYASAAKASGNNFQSGRFPLPVIVPDSTGTATWSDQNVFAPAVVHDPAPVPPDAPLPLWRIWYTGTGSTGRGIGYIQGN
ncbi:MAG TPA: hypothetical protein VEJ18_04025, partial [Planctomycetota bacterium]|nr:hypothetical protein [Planctomycetota bacterium]